MTTPLALALLLLGGAPAATIKWEKSFDDALKKAKASGKPIFVDFWAEWCTWCHRLDKTTYVDPAVVLRSEEFVAVKVNTEAGKREELVALQYDVQNLPTILFLSPGGHLVLRLSAYQGPGHFPRTMDRALENARRVGSMEAAIERNPRDAAALLDLGIHLYEQEVYEESRDFLKQAVKHGAAEPPAHRRKARMLLAIIQNFDRKYGEAEALLKEALAIRPAGPDEPKLLFVLGRTYASWGKVPDSQRTMETLVRRYPQDPLAPKAKETIVALERRQP
jgi:thioredoxin-like negative regulator of GroEL